MHEGVRTSFYCDVHKAARDDCKSWVSLRNHVAAGRLRPTELSEELLKRERQ
jgi:hypothetical protein